MENKPTAAIIGLGVGLNAHLPSLRAAGFDVVALGAQRADALAAAGTAHGIAALYTDMEALLAHPGLDAVVIASPPPTHAALVRSALAAGKHVLVEKAFAMTADEADAMAAAARQAGKTAMVAHAYRFAPSRAYVADLLAQGHIGTPRQIAISFFWAPPEGAPLGPSAHWRWGYASGGGMSGGQASSFFDAVLAWFGPVSAIAGKVRAHDLGLVRNDGQPADADDTFAATFETASGVLGSMILSAAAPFGEGGRIEIFGSEGRITIHQPFIVSSPGDRVVVERYGAASAPDTQIPDAYALAVPDECAIEPMYQAYLPLARAFRHGIATGTSPSPDFAESCHLQRISDALRHSAHTSAAFIDPRQPHQQWPQPQ